LHGAEENAVLIVGGDNDTFPLWCLQQAYRIRRDVKVINLALANSKWYIKQARDYMGLKLPWTDEQIDGLRPYRVQDGRIFKLQDILVDAIIQNNPEIPVNWSVTVRPSERRYSGIEIDSLLSFRGMSYYLEQRARSGAAEGDLAYGFFTDTSRFIYNSMADHSLFRREATRRVVGNVARSILKASDVLRSEGRPVEAREVVKKGMAIVPGSSRTISTLARLYLETDDIDSIRMLPALYPNSDQKEIQLTIAQALRRIDESDEARRLLDSLLVTDPQYRPALDEMMRLLVQARDAEYMIVVLERWLAANPDDHELNSALADLKAQLNEAPSSDN
jgi:hypothetical protein